MVKWQNQLEACPHLSVPWEPEGPQSDDLLIVGAQ